MADDQLAQMYGLLGGGSPGMTPGGPMGFLTPGLDPTKLQSARLNGGLAAAAQAAIRGQSPLESLAGALAGFGEGADAGERASLQRAMMQAQYGGLIQQQQMALRKQQALMELAKQPPAGADPAQWRTLVMQSPEKAAEILGKRIDPDLTQLVTRDAQGNPIANQALIGAEAAKSGATAGATAEAQQPYEFGRMDRQGQISLNNTIAGQNNQARNDVRTAMPIAQGREAGQIAAQLAAGQNGQPVAYDLALAKEGGQQAAQRPTTSTKLASGLRSEFTKEQPVQMLDQVQPIAQSIKRTIGQDTKAADLDLVYGIAKMLDPGSVVREGEMVMVQNTGSLPSQVLAAIGAVNGGGRIAPETRASLASVAQSRYDAIHSQAAQVANQYQTIATKAGIDPADVVRGFEKVDLLGGNRLPGTAAPAPQLPSGPRGAPPPASSAPMPAPQQQAPGQSLGQAPPSAAGSWPTVSSPNDPAYLKLPSGSVFRTQDGRMKIKP